MEDHSDICWRNNTAGIKPSRMFLECVGDDSFLLQVIGEPRRRGALLDLILTNKEWLVGEVKVKGSLGCSAHEMVEFRILKVRRRVKSIWDSRRAEFGLFKDLLGKVPQNETLEGRAGQESWLIFKAHPPSSRGVHPNKYDVRQKMPGGLHG